MSTRASSASASGSGGSPRSAAAAGQADRRAGPEAQQAERMRPDRAQVPDSRGRVAKLTWKEVRTARSPAVELIQPAAAGRPAGRRAFGRSSCARGQPRARDPDRQRQARADRQHRLVAAGSGEARARVGPDDAVNRLRRILGFVERSPGSPRRLPARSEHLVPGRDDHGARAAAGQQRLHLGCVPWRHPGRSASDARRARVRYMRGAFFEVSRYAGPVHTRGPARTWPEPRPGAPAGSLAPRRLA